MSMKRVVGKLRQAVKTQRSTGGSPAQSSPPFLANAASAVIASRRQGHQEGNQNATPDGRRGPATAAPPTSGRTPRQGSKQSHLGLS
ncbi:unnamed protein product, partial [Amoebophrya sp. A25]|eukprot:GSA25T00002079001.1